MTRQLASWPGAFGSLLEMRQREVQDMPLGVLILTEGQHHGEVVCQ